MAWERVVLPARSASWAGDSADESRSSADRRDRAVARIRQDLAAGVDSHRVPAEAAGTHRGLAAVAGDARVSAVSVGSGPGRARRDVVGPVGDLSRDHGEAVAPADLDTGRNSCLGIVTIPSGEGIPPGGNDPPLVGAGICSSIRSASGARAAGRERVLVVHPAAAVSRSLTTHYTDLLGTGPTGRSSQRSSADSPPPPSRHARHPSQHSRAGTDSSPAAGPPTLRHGGPDPPGPSSSAPRPTPSWPPASSTSTPSDSPGSTRSSSSNTPPAGRMT
jgi:hypothetical protein